MGDSGAWSRGLYVVGGHHGDVPGEIGDGDGVNHGPLRSRPHAKAFHHPHSQLTEQFLRFFFGGSCGSVVTTIFEVLERDIFFYAVVVLVADST